MKNLFVTLHNVYSSQKIREMTELILGFGVETFIISKAEGSAATVGVPESHKMILKKGKNLIFVKDLPDAIELLNPDDIFTFIHKPYAKNKFNVTDVINSINNNKKVMLIFGGSKPGLSKKELNVGNAVYLDLPSDIGSIGYAAVVLYEILKNLNS
ncbi:MAG: RecB-family nuclease [Candidatus Helarchaeota archaeon]